jgi:hypothetical protein
VVQDLRSWLGRQGIRIRNHLPNQGLDFPYPNRDRVWVSPLLSLCSVSLTFSPYLIRHEIIAMHDPDDPQVYPYCIQANIKSSGNVVPTDTVTFPAAYNMNDDFKHFNLYYGDDFNAFRPPGPAVWNGAGSQAPSTPAPASSSIDDAPVAPTDVAPASSDNGYEPSSTTLMTSGAHATGRCKRR